MKIVHYNMGISYSVQPINTIVIYINHFLKQLINNFDNK